MAKALFITRNDLITFTSANGNLDPDKFLPYVRLASDIYLQTYLGTELYKKIEALIEAGAISVDAYVTHGVLSGAAVSKIFNSPLKNLVTTDSIRATETVKLVSNIRQLSIAPILGEAIRRVHTETSVSSLFD